MNRLPMHGQLRGFKHSSLAAAITLHVTCCLVLIGALATGVRADSDRPAPSLTDHEVVLLWPTGAPTLQGTDEKEITVPPNPKPGERIRSVKNIHNPSMEVHLPPAEKANGCAIIVAGGGAHREINVGSEGTDIADWLNSLGIAAFVLKYRLAQTPGYHYSVEGEALQDTQRAVRIVRDRAKAWGVNSQRVGILGFSAGGALAALADIRFDRGQPDAPDPIDHQSCRPDFVGLVYAGWQPMDITAPKDAAPAFLTSAGLDDLFHSKETVDFYQELIKAQVPTELHIYGHGGHAGGISDRHGIPLGTWHHRFEEWLADLKMLTKPQP